MNKLNFEYISELEESVEKDCLFIMWRLFDEFPELFDENDDSPISGADLVDFMCDQIHGCDYLKMDLKGHLK